MSSCHINLIHFSSRVVFIDDDEDFLAAMARQFKNPLYRYYTNPEQALADLQQVTDTSIAEFLQVDNLESSEDELSSLNLMISGLSQKINDPERHNLVSVIVVDQTMPMMDGLSLCEVLKDKSFKKIMLTASSDFQMATAAFNSGKIDKFIVKDSPTMLQELQVAVVELQQRFFYEYSLPLSKIIEKTASSALDNDDYLKLWQKITIESKVIEYCLLDSRGSYVLINEKGIRTRLIVRHEKDMDNYYNIARDNGANEKLLEKLKTKQYAPIFLSEEDYHLPIDQWLDNLQEFQKLAPASSFYYILFP